MNFDDIRKRLDYEGAEDQTSTASDAPSEAGGGSQTEAIAVYLRLRPFTADDVAKGNKKRPYEIVGKTAVSLGSLREHVHSVGGNPLAAEMHMLTTYTFTEVFDETSSQQAVFDTSVLPSVKQFLTGRDCLVFAYGMTNSGKTFTMQGSAKEPGIIPRSLNHIFASLDGKLYPGMDLKPRLFADVVRLSSKEAAAEVAAKSSVLNVEKLPFDSTFMSQTSSFAHSSQTSLVSEADEIGIDAASDAADDCCDNENSALGALADREATQYSVWLSFAEIHNEQLYDLLEPAPSSRGVPVRRKLLKMAEDGRGQPYVKDLRSVCVCSAEDAARLIAAGQKNLQYACTRLNENSSRSHCVLTLRLLHVVGGNHDGDVTGSTASHDQPHVTRVNTLSFCDLAGSERSSRTQSAGDRLKEAGSINTSMLTLGRCITALRDITLHQQQQCRARGPAAQTVVVPFRESKLTRLFQNFFCGKGRVSMIVNVSQCHSDYDENLHALKFSAIAQKSAFVPVKPEFKVPPPVRRKSSRLLSLAVTQDMSRPSIPWATPGTIAALGEVGQRVSLLLPPDVPPAHLAGTALDQHEVPADRDSRQPRATHASADGDGDAAVLTSGAADRPPVGEDGEAVTHSDDDGESSDDSEDELVHYYQQRESQFRQAIEELTKALCSARQEVQDAKVAADAREKSVRAEICTAWKEDVARLEERHRARLEEERESARQLMDQKVELIEDFVHKSAMKRGRWQRRRSNSESSDDDEAAASLQPKQRKREPLADETDKENAASRADVAAQKRRSEETNPREKADFPSSSSIAPENQPLLPPSGSNVCFAEADTRRAAAVAGVQGRSLRHRQPCGGGSPRCRGDVAGGISTLAACKLGSAFVNSPFSAKHTKTSMLRLQANGSESPGRPKADKCMDSSCFLNRPEKRKRADGGPEAETRSSARKRRHVDTAGAAAAAAGSQGAVATAAAPRQQQQRRRVSSIMRQRYEMRKRNKRQ